MVAADPEAGRPPERATAPRVGRASLTLFPPAQAPGPGLNYIVLLTCAVCFVTYSVAALIVHKLDLIDVNRVGVIPFCGKNGQYKYEILVKTGWGRGSGESGAGVALR